MLKKASCGIATYGLKRLLVVTNNLHRQLMLIGGAFQYSGWKSILKNVIGNAHERSMVVSTGQQDCIAAKWRGDKLSR